MGVVLLTSGNWLTTFGHLETQRCNGFGIDQRAIGPDPREVSNGCARSDEKKLERWNHRRALNGNTLPSVVGGGSDVYGG